MVDKLKSFFLENKTLTQTVAKNTAWLTISTVISRGVRALLVLYAARILGTEGYGVFSYAMSLAAFFCIFSDIGLSALLTREAVKQPEKIKSYLSTTLFLKSIMLGGTLMVGIIFAPMVITIAAAKPLISLALLLLIFDNLRSFGFSITRAQNKMEVEATFSALTDILITCISLTVLFLIPDAWWLSLAYVIGSALGTLIVFWIIRENLIGITKHFDKTLIKPILTSAWPFAIMGVLGAFMINIDTLIIGWFSSAHELGLYSAAQRVPLLLYVLPTLLASSVFPILSRLIHTGEGDRIKEVMETSIRSVMIIALPLAIGGIILAKPIVELIFGSAYEQAWPTLSLLMFTILLVFPGTLISNAIFAYDKQKTFIFSTSMGAGSNVILDLILIPIYGIFGSAMATVIAQILVNGINLRTLKNISDFKLSGFGKMLIAVIGMGLAVFFFNLKGLHVLPNVLLGCLVYLGLLTILKESLLQEVWEKINVNNKNEILN